LGVIVLFIIVIINNEILSVCQISGEVLEIINVQDIGKDVISVDTLARSFSCLLGAF